MYYRKLSECLLSVNNISISLIIFFIHNEVLKLYK